MADEDRPSFSDWWGELVFYDDEGREYESDTYDYTDRIWAIEYAYDHGWDEQEIMDAMYEDSADFWEWWRENYGGT